MRRRRGTGVAVVEDYAPVASVPVARPVDGRVLEGQQGAQAPQVVLVQLPQPPVSAVAPSAGSAARVVAYAIGVVAAVALAAWSFTTAPWHEPASRDGQGQQVQQERGGR